MLDRLIDQDSVDQINREIDPVLYGANLGLADASIVAAGRRINSSLRHSPTIANLVAANPVVLGLAGSFLLEHCDTLQISATQIAEIAPGDIAQPLHRDDYTSGHIKGRTHPLSFVLIMALTKFTPALGGTRYIPGNHLWEDALTTPEKRNNWKDGIYAQRSYLPGQYEELVAQPTLTPGSALAFLGTTVHGAGANTTTDVYRRALIIQYCVGWVRPSHSNHLLYPPEIAKSLPRPVQMLLSYQLEAKHCGQLEQGVDPIVLLRD